MTEIVLPGGTKPASQGTLVEQARAVAEVAAAVRVALDFPRDESKAADRMTALCGRLSVAQRAFYEVPNRGAGMSIHIARELARIWGNVDYGVRELRRDDVEGVSEMQVWAWDQEQNVRTTRSFIQPHQRMKGGKRQALTDLGDIYLANQNTGARAVRECIFAMLPGWFVSEAEEILRGTLEHGEGQPIEERATAAVGAFGKLGITQKMLESRIGSVLTKWSPADVADLSRVYASITQDGIPAADFFPEQPVTIPAEITETGR